mmetsp:Transcript_9993/g.32758  ORF Transcript_9993/g.32758 Transcript_9993/m.32758 type:complete len:350 (-) Transcript_9993:165-1214(-)
MARSAVARRLAPFLKVLCESDDGGVDPLRCELVNLLFVALRLEPGQRLVLVANLLGRVAPRLALQPVNLLEVEPRGAVLLPLAVLAEKVGAEELPRRLWLLRKLRQNLLQVPVAAVAALLARVRISERVVLVLLHPPLRRFRDVTRQLVPTLAHLAPHNLLRRARLLRHARLAARQAKVWLLLVEIHPFLLRVENRPANRIAILVHPKIAPVALRHRSARRPVPHTRAQIAVLPLLFEPLAAGAHGRAPFRFRDWDVRIAALARDSKFLILAVLALVVHRNLELSIFRELNLPQRQLEVLLERLVQLLPLERGAIRPVEVQQLPCAHPAVVSLLPLRRRVSKVHDRHRV